MNMTERHLRMFTTTAALGNISRASEQLHVSQPALTRALQEFESQLGVKLFDRTTRRLALTHEGERFMPVAQRLLADMQQAALELREQSTGTRGTVSIAVGTAFGCTVLPAVLGRFTASHPHVRVHLVDDNSAGITNRVSRAEVDLGIGSPVGETHHLRCQKLLDAPIGLLCDPGAFALKTSVTDKQLASLPLLKEPADTSIAHLLRAHGSALVPHMERGIEVSSLALQLALASAGVGVAVLSALGASHPQAASLRFTPLRARILREVFLLTRPDRPLSPSCRALVQTLSQVMASTELQLHPGVRFAPLDL